MNEKERNELIKTKIKPKIGIIKNELAKVSDIDIRKEGERLHRELSIVKVEDLLRPFTL